MTGTYIKHGRKPPRRVLEVVDQLPPQEWIGAAAARAAAAKARKKRPTLAKIYGPLAKDVLAHPGQYSLIDVLPFRTEVERKAFHSYIQTLRRAGEIYGFKAVQRVTADGKHVRIYGYAPPATTNGTV